MNTKEAIIAFAQSEKLKAAMIWASQWSEMVNHLEGGEKTGAEKLLCLAIGQMAGEAGLARQLTEDAAWSDVEKALRTARIMIDSGVAEEATYHLTQALSQITGVGQRAMTWLNDQGLLT